MYWTAYQDDLEKCLLINLHELLVPLINLGQSLSIVDFFLLWDGVASVMLTPVDNLGTDNIWYTNHQYLYNENNNVLKGVPFSESWLWHWEGE